MAPIVRTVDIDRPPEEVFAYVTDPSRFGEWQESVVRSGVEGGEPTLVGAKCVTTRRLGGRERDATQEIVRCDPPRSWAVRGLDGPVRGNVDVTVEPLDGGTRSHVTIELEFIGHGIGRVIVPLLVAPQGAKESSRSCEKLKRNLEAGVGTG